jgi:ornithine carbamoyltransferase
MKDFINLNDFTPPQLQSLLDRAIADKALFRARKLPQTLVGKTLAMIFEKPSLRTRVSFETAMSDLGGHAIYLTQAEIGIGSREAVQDIARVLARMCDGIMARTFSHELVEKLAQWADVPVINALTDYSHPCQAMADLMTAQEHFGPLAGRTLTFVGDGNNVARSLATACCKLDMRFILACPRGYELERQVVTEVCSVGKPDCCRVMHDACAAVAGADVVYTDTWVSMGQEDQKAKRQKDFAGYQVNMDLMSHAPKHAIVMHCLPAYRGFEIDDECFEKYVSHILDEAENRVHFQRSLLAVLIGEGGIK